MKNNTKILLLIIFTLLLGCRPKANQERDLYTKENSDTTVIKVPKRDQNNERKKKQIDVDWEIDSLRLDFAIKDAFKIAKTTLHLNSFLKQYEFQPDDSSYIINIEILIGRLFGNNKKYFLLRRQVPWATYLDLYKVIDDKTEKLIEREQGGMTYIRDSILDVNGDGFNDFLVHWYPSSGCCRRNVYNVYLYQPDIDNFTKDYEFINPTFSAKEKIIRGIEYGHPGEVGLYKYKWNGLKIDTIEFIYPDVSMKGKFIKTNKSSFRPTHNDGIVLNSVPKEYHNIESYEWFADY